MFVKYETVCHFSPSRSRSLSFSPVLFLPLDHLSIIHPTMLPKDLCSHKWLSLFGGIDFMIICKWGSFINWLRLNSKKFFVINTVAIEPLFAVCFDSIRITSLNIFICIQIYKIHFQWKAISRTHTRMHIHRKVISCKRAKCKMKDYTSFKSRLFFNYPLLICKPTFEWNLLDWATIDAVLSRCVYMTSKK